MVKQKWEIALDKFLKDWKENPEVTGILVCGSYITGNPTKHSDVDIQIILRRGCEWRERGNKIVDGILMEYFANPPERIVGYLEDDQKRRRKIEAHMLSTGKVYLDRDGEVEKLKVFAREYLEKGFDGTPSFKVELNKYHLWDMMDNLGEVLNRGTPDFMYVYHNFLRNLLTIYTEFLKYPDMHENKTFRFLSNKKDRTKYAIPEMSDKAFSRKFIEAIKETNKKKAMNLFNGLAKHVQDKMGGFDISNWKFRSSAK